MFQEVSDKNLQFICFRIKVSESHIKGKMIPEPGKDRTKWMILLGLLRFRGRRKNFIIKSVNTDKQKAHGSEKR
jgi:hypothetical protein